MPDSVIEGFRIASKAALAALENAAEDHGCAGFRLFPLSHTPIFPQLTLSNGRTRPTCSKNPAQFREDLLAIARTTLSSKVLAADKDYFAELAVSAVLRLKGSTDLDHIQIIKKQGGKLTDSYLDEGFILDKKIGVNCPHRMENAKIMIANTRESGGVFSSQLFGGCI